MLPWSGEQSVAVVGGPGQRLFTGSDGPVTMLWCATKRERETNSTGGLPYTADQATRTATSCYMRGLKEKIAIATSGSSSWRWRRICFRFKSDAFVNIPDVLPGEYTSVLSNLTSNGYARSLNSFNLTDANQTTMLNRVYAYVFQGTAGQDWTTPFTAKTDPERITPAYDRTFIIQSGNDAGVMRDFNFWHPMNKTLIYDEDEAGGVQQSGDLSAIVPSSMGDYYVMDIITCNDANSEQLSFNPTATLYWHER